MSAFRWMITGCLVLLVAAVAVADMVICQGCGWEVDSAAGVCSHCGRKIEVKPPVEEPEDESSPDTAGQDEKNGVVSDEVVNEEVALARKSIASGDR